MIGRSSDSTKQPLIARSPDEKGVRDLRTPSTLFKSPVDAMSSSRLYFFFLVAFFAFFFIGMLVVPPEFDYFP